MRRHQRSRYRHVAVDLTVDGTLAAESGEGWTHVDLDGLRAFLAVVHLLSIERLGVGPQQGIGIVGRQVAIAHIRGLGIEGNVGSSVQIALGRGIDILHVTIHILFQQIDLGTFHFLSALHDLGIQLAGGSPETELLGIEFVLLTEGEVVDGGVHFLAKAIILPRISNGIAARSQHFEVLCGKGRNPRGSCLLVVHIKSKEGLWIGNVVFAIHDEALVEELSRAEDGELAHAKGTGVIEVGLLIVALHDFHNLIAHVVGGHGIS